MLQYSGFHIAPGSQTPGDYVVYIVGVFCEVHLARAAFYDRQRRPVQIGLESRREITRSGFVIVQFYTTCSITVVPYGVEKRADPQLLPK
jgi:hypothetical protein